MRVVDVATAKWLQELRYDGPAYLSYDIAFNPPRLVSSEGRIIDRLSAPRLDDVAYWIEDKFDMGIYPYNEDKRRGCAIMIGSFQLTWQPWFRYFPTLDSKRFHSFESALECGVMSVVEHLINLKQQGANL